MADSVDRVFGHALNTVNKIRTGSQKPPVADRLKLYGLYKQSMEGDVSYIQDRPTGTTEQARKEQEKWDAWHANSSLSRTEAKKRYIETLIQTMHTYASSTTEARELVSELEFVWDQVKNNSNPSSSSGHGSSPLQTHDHDQQSYPGMVSSSVGALDTPRGRPSNPTPQEPKMRLLSPTSEPDAARPAEEKDEDEREEFVDAPVSQFGDQEPSETPADETTTPPSESGSRPPARRTTANDARWRKRIETALFKTATEIAALREQLENRQYGAVQRRKSVLGWMLRVGWFMVRLVVVDVLVLWGVILWLRRKKDRRLEGAVRVMLGDAQVGVKELAGRVGRGVASRGRN